eukprot:scaffold13658_cov125-Skeletonema_marinoi.AAC.2
MKDLQTICSVRSILSAGGSREREGEGINSKSNERRFGETWKSYSGSGFVDVRIKPICKCHFDYDLKTQVKVFLTFTCVSPQSIQDPRAHQIIRFQVKIPDFHEMRILFRLNSYAHHYFSPDPSTTSTMAWIK